MVAGVCVVSTVSLVGIGTSAGAATPTRGATQRPASGTRTPAPTVAGLTAARSLVLGGHWLVTLTATVDHAVSCTFSSNKPATGLSIAAPCTSGVVSDPVEIPVGTRKKAVTYTFTLAVTGTKTVKAKVTVPDGTTTCTDITPDADLARCDLVGADLAGADLAGADLTGADLAGADLGSTDLSGATLAGTDLTGAVLTEATLSETDLAGAQLTGTELSGATSGGIIGEPSALPEDWRLVDGYLVGPDADLAGAHLDGADLAGADLTDASLGSASLIGVDLSGAVLTGASGSPAVSGGVTGTPAALPAGWALVEGYLVGPGDDLAGLDLSGTDLAGVDLSGTDLSDADLTDADLQGTSISGVDLTGATLTGLVSGGLVGTTSELPPGWTVTSGYLVGSGADLVDADLQFASLAFLDLSDTDLSGAQLQGSDFQGATLTDDDLSGANLSAVNLESATLTDDDLSQVNLTAAILSDADLHGADLEGDSLEGTDLFRADLGSSTLSGTYLVAADLHGADLSASNLAGADLVGAQLADAESGGIIGTPSELPSGWELIGGFLIGPGADLGTAGLSGLDLSGVDLVGADLYGATLTGTNLSSADLSDADLLGADLSDGDLDGAALTHADLTGADATGADLTGAELTGADLLDVDLDGAILTLATWSDTTCPDGTDSDDDGATCAANESPAPAPPDLVGAVTAAQAAAAENDGSFQGMTFAQLDAADPSVQFIPDPSTGGDQISTYVSEDGNGIVLATTTGDGVCWYEAYNPYVVVQDSGPYGGPSPAPVAQGFWSGVSTDAASCQPGGPATIIWQSGTSST